MGELETSGMPPNGYRTPNTGKHSVCDAGQCLKLVCYRSIDEENHEDQRGGGKEETEGGQLTQHCQAGRENQGVWLSKSAWEDTGGRADRQEAMTVED